MRARDERAARWRALLAEQAESGLTLKAFAQSRGVSVNALGYWKYKRLRREEGSALGLVPVRVVSDGPRAEPGFVDVLLRGGRCLRVRSGFDAELLWSVIRALESSC